MFQKAKISILAAAAIVTIAAAALHFIFPNFTKSAPSSIHRPIFTADFNHDFLQSAVLNAEPVKINLLKVRGGIAPHHDLAAELMADLFKSLSESGARPDTFVIFAPKHDNSALAPAVTCDVDWQTEYGLLKSAEPLYTLAMDKTKLINDCDSFKEEYSAKNLLPFIKYYFPDARILIVLMTADYQEEGLAEFFTNQGGDNKIFFLSSLDFSHYLDSESAKKNDQLTLSLIETRNYASIANLNSDYLDSAPALELLLRIMDNLGANQTQVLNHAEMGDLLGQPISRSTSYYTMVFGD